MTPEDDKHLEIIGDRIRTFRLKLGLTQPKLSFKCKLSASYIGSVERGERNLSSLNLIKIAESLGVKVGDFFD